MEFRYVDGADWRSCKLAGFYISDAELSSGFCYQSVSTSVRQSVTDIYRMPSLKWQPYETYIRGDYKWCELLTYIYWQESLTPFVITLYYQPGPGAEFSSEFQTYCTLSDKRIVWTIHIILRSYSADNVLRCGDITSTATYHYFCQFGNFIHTVLHS